MTRGKKWLLGALALLLAAAMAGAWYFLGNWPLRFRGDLDAFFGPGNWKVLSEETKLSRMYSVYVHDSGLGTDTRRPGDYHNWDIEAENAQGGRDVFRITDHAMKINHSKYFFLSPRYLSARQALALELRDSSFAIAGERAWQEVVAPLLPEEEAGCIQVDISFRGGNPPPEFYDRLLEQRWFTAADVSAEAYLGTELYDFYLQLRAHDYRVNQLSEEGREHLLASLPALEAALREAYGGSADYEIYLGEGVFAKYPEP